MSDSSIHMWVIYDHPRDLPDGFAVRNFASSASDGAAIVSPGKLLGSGLPSIDEARALVPEGAVNIGRQPEDDPVIVEVWI